MKVKTSITLSEDLIGAIDEHSDEFKNRSDFIETAVRSYLARRVRSRQDAHDLAVINKNAARLNKEALDALSYQRIP